MAAPENNTYWTSRESHGRSPIYEDPEELWKECQKYFEWVQSNPLKEEKVFHNSGDVTRTEVSKMRAMTLKGLCLFLGICEKTWWNYRNKEDFLQVTTRVENVIYAQKFEGAAADLLNSNIIARDLGLKDSQQLEHSGNISLFDALTEDYGESDTEESAG